MKFTINWLKRHLDTTASLEEICETLTAIGLEVEEVTDPAEKFAAFSVAHVREAEQHPNADRLKLCTVETRNGEYKVVCGAPNARAGMKGIFAPEGSYIPGLDVTLKKTKIRGVESCGMLVSEKEMQLSDQHEGIIEVDESWRVGTPMAEVFGLDDPVIEIALTPNRADCAGVRGIARDLAAAGLGTLKPLEALDIEAQEFAPVQVSIEDNEGCPHFLGRVIKGVQNGPSPDWLQNLLKAVGLRPISALVDITNFINLDHARPLHVYDADKLTGDIRVAATKAGQDFDALDDKTYSTIDGAVGIYDDSGLIGLGGIVGGTGTGSTPDTTNVFLEAAYFSPRRIARTGRDMGIVSDARYRFERGVDPEFTHTGMEIATAMILEICGGQAGKIVEAGAKPEWERKIAYDPAYCEELIGLDIQAKTQFKILEDLGFRRDGNQISVPSWRGDVEGRADIVEEVIRITGFEQIPEIAVRPAKTVPDTAETTLLSRGRKARTALAGRGLNECVTWSFMAQQQAKIFTAANEDNGLEIQNPISAEMNRMRPTILPNLIAAAQGNANRGYRNSALFEVGPVFRHAGADGQDIVACGLRFGQASPRHWADDKAARDTDLFDVKADALAALNALDAPVNNAQVGRDAPVYYHPGRSGSIRLGKNVLAFFGEIHPAVLDELDIKAPVNGFEIFLQNVPEPRRKGTEKTLLTLEPLQPLSRDFAFIVDQSVSAEDIIRAAKGADKSLVQDADVFDVYQGKGVPDDKKSVAVAVAIQPRDQSLSDKDLEILSQKIADQVQQKTGGVLRG